jgi:hypothetical protein
MRAFFAIQFGLLLLAATSCGGDATEPKENVVNARIVSPYSDDGAVFLELTGTVESVVAPEGTTAYTHPIGGSATRVLLIRDTPGPIEFTIRLPRGAAPPGVKVLEVSDGQDQPRADISAYSVQY